MLRNSERHFTTALLTAGFALAISAMANAMAATDIVSTGFILDPALPDYEDPNAAVRVITGYTAVPIENPFQLPGGAPLDEGVNDFSYPATRIGKFVFDINDITSLFPVPGNANGFKAVATSVTMAITDLDTNLIGGGPAHESDYKDVIFALAATDADDGSTLVRILTNMDGGNPITPQFLTGFGNQALSDLPDVATNDYDLSVAPQLGNALAELYSASGGEIWLYIIDADDSGNFVSLANSLASDFSLTTTFASVPLPPALLLLSSAACALLMVRRRTM